MAEAGGAGLLEVFGQDVKWPRWTARKNVEVFGLYMVAWW
jgi:hypothetical protein